MVKPLPPHLSRAVPTISVEHPEYQWRTGADVQATWMRLTSWRPIHSNQPPKYVEPKEAAFTKLRRFK